MAQNNNFPRNSMPSKPFDRLDAASNALGKAQTLSGGQGDDNLIDSGLDTAKKSVDAAREAKSVAKAAKRIKAASAAGPTGTVAAALAEAAKDPQLALKIVAVSLAAIMILAALLFALGYYVIALIQGVINEFKERYWEVSTGSLLEDTFWGVERTFGSFIGEALDEMGVGDAIDSIKAYFSSEEDADAITSEDANDIPKAASDEDAALNLLRRRMNAIQTRIDRAAGHLEDAVDRALTVSDIFGDGLLSSDDVFYKAEAVANRDIYIELPALITTDTDVHVSSLDALKLLAAYTVQHDVDYRSVNLADVLLWAGYYDGFTMTDQTIDVSDVADDTKYTYVAGTRDENAQSIFYYLHNEVGLPAAACCGVLGTLDALSGLKVDSCSDLPDGYTVDSYISAVKNQTYSLEEFSNDGVAFGLCGWATPDRKRDLYQNAYSEGTTIDDLNVQLSLLKYEMLSKTFGTYNALKDVSDTTDGVNLAAEKFAKHHIDPYISDSNVERCQQLAMAFWQIYQDNGFTYQPTNWVDDTFSGFRDSYSAFTASQSVDVSNTELAYFPAKSFSVYQSDMTSTASTHAHSGTFAIDIGEYGGTCSCYAPFTMQIKYISNDGYNIVIAQSINKVQFADGRIDYMCMLLEHDSDVSDLYVNQVIPQGREFYQQGTANTETPHVHIEFAKGQYFDGIAHGGIRCIRGSGCSGTHYGMDENVRVRASSACVLWPEANVIADKGYHFKNAEDVRKTVALDNTCLILGDVNLSGWKTLPNSSIANCRTYAKNDLGITTEDLSGWIKAQGNFDSVIIMLGQNDYSNTSALYNSYFNLLNKIFQINPRATVIMCSVLPVTDTLAASNGYNITGTQISSINSIIRSVYSRSSATHGNNLVFVDLSSHFAAADNSLLYTEDGITLTTEGYAELNKYMSGIISNLAITTVNSDSSEGSGNGHVLEFRLSDGYSFSILLPNWHGSFVPQCDFEMFEQIAEKKYPNDPDAQALYVHGLCTKYGDSLVEQMLYIPPVTVSDTIQVYPNADDPALDELRLKYSVIDDEIKRVEEIKNSPDQLINQYSDYAYTSRLTKDTVVGCVIPPNDNTPVFCPLCCQEDESLAAHYQAVLRGEEDLEKQDYLFIVGTSKAVGTTTSCLMNHHKIFISDEMGKSAKLLLEPPKKVYVHRFVADIQIRLRTADDLAANVLGFWDGPLTKHDENGINRYSTNPDPFLLAYAWMWKGNSYHRLQGYQLDAYLDAALACANELGIDSETMSGFVSPGFHRSEGDAAAIVTAAEAEYANGGDYDGGAKYGPRHAWCCAFVCYCARQLGYVESGVFPCSTNSCAVLYSGFEARGQTYTQANNPDFVPRSGDLIFFDSDLNTSFFQHVGIVESVDADGTVHTIEGNFGGGEGQIGHGTYSRGIWGLAWTKSNGTEIYITAYARPEY